MNDSSQTENQPPARSVTVVIAAYNASVTIARAVRSALAEPEVAEVIVVDDGSNDGTSSCAGNADDGSGRLRILLQPSNGGPSAARNRAICESRAPWIAVLDSDDFFLPGRICGLLACATNADLVADDMWQVPESDVDGPRKSLFSEALKEPRLVSFSEFVLWNVTDRKRPRAELGFIKPLMRRDFLAQHSLRYQEHMRLGEDYELYARALALGARLKLIPVQGYVSVVRDNSLSGRHTETDLLHLLECDHAIGQLSGLRAPDKDALRRHYGSIDCRLQWRLLIMAVKRGDWSACRAGFARPYPVPFYLLARLAERAIPRKALKLRRAIMARIPVLQRKPVH